MRIRKKYLFYILALLSSVISASVVSIDTTISYFFIKNPWIFGFSAFLAGTLITLILSLILSIPINKKSIGSRIDPSFSHLRLVRKEELKYHVLAGLGNAITTIGYFYILSIFIDPSAVLPFYQVVILYLLLIESIAEKNAPTLIEIQSALIVTFGAVMASISLTGEINLIGLLIVFLVVNPSWALFSIYQRKLKLLRIGNKSNDAINIRFWNLVFTTIFTGVLVSISNRSYFFESFVTAFNYMHILFLSMGVTFFSYILYIRALGMGKASVTQAVRASTIIFSIPFSVLLSHFLPFSVFITPTLLVIKIMGMILVVIGIISFALTEVKAYIFVNVRPGYSVEKIIDSLWKINGVTAVAAVAGKYDIIAKIRTRTLVKGYERVIRKLETIEGIRSFTWQSILKEWEEI
jgi:DNA-binding Lrp family transcriptional regulator